MSGRFDGREEDHFRSGFRPGDFVTVRGHSARLIGWNNTWSHLTGGRLAHLDRGEERDEAEWEDNLEPLTPFAHATGNPREGWERYEVRVYRLGTFRCADGHIRSS